jgi:hypothetical protein
MVLSRAGWRLTKGAADMQQSNTIFAALFLAFIVFVTMRGNLRKYMGFLLSTG